MTSLLDAMAGGLAADDALAALTTRTGDIAYRQLAVVDVAGRSACYSGELALGEAADICAPGAAAAGNLLADLGVPAAMLGAFGDTAGESLGDRLIAALRAGLDAGGEVSPVRSAGMVIAESVPWPVTDLRVDWHDDPVGRARRPVASLAAAGGVLRAARAAAGAGMTAGLRVGLAQWTPDRDPGVNLRTAESAVRAHGRRVGRLAVFPGLWLCGYRAGADPHARRVAARRTM